MANELDFLVSLFAAFAGGAGTVLLFRRRAPAIAAPAPEEPVRENALEETLASERRRAEALEKELRIRDERLASARTHIETLEKQVSSYLRQYAVSKDILRKELLQKNALNAELAAANAQVEALRGRVQELELGQTGRRTAPPV